MSYTRNMAGAVALLASSSLLGLGCMVAADDKSNKDADDESIVADEATKTDEERLAKGDNSAADQETTGESADALGGFGGGLGRGFGGGLGRGFGGGFGGYGGYGRGFGGYGGFNRGFGGYGRAIYGGYGGYGGGYGGYGGGYGGYGYGYPVYGGGYGGYGGYGGNGGYGGYGCGY